MATRKITITVDEGLLIDAEAFMEETGQANMSGLIGEALREHITRGSIERVKEWRAKTR